MRHVAIGMLLLVALGCQVTGGPHGDGSAVPARKVAKGESGFVAAYVGGARPAPVPAAKVSAIKLQGKVTLGALVKALGPGWIDPNSGVGWIQWRMDDGRSLLVVPSEYESGVVLKQEDLDIVPAGLGDGG